LAAKSVPLNSQALRHVSRGHSYRHLHDGVRFTTERCGLSEPRQTDTCSAANSFLFRSPSVGSERAGGVL